MESITLQTGDNIITSGDILGKLQFAASAEGDAVGRLLSASLYAQAESAFTSAGNATSLVFSTSSNDTNPTVARLKVGPDGDFLPVVDATYDIGASSLRFQDAYFSGGVFLSDATPPVTTNKLYNSGGSLYFNGSAVGGGGSYTAGSGLMLVGNQFNIYGGSGHFLDLDIENSSSVNTPLIVRGAASQSANLQEWQNSSSQILSKIDSNGALTANGIVVSGASGGVATLVYNSASNNTYTFTTSFGGTTKTIACTNTVNTFSETNAFTGQIRPRRPNTSGFCIQFEPSTGSTSDVGFDSTSSRTLNFLNNATTSGSTKTLTICGGGVSGSTTNITIGSSISGATNTTTLYGTLTHNGVLTTDGVSSDYYRTTSDMIITESGTTRTLSASDNGKIIRCTSGSATTITVPTGLDVGFSVTVIQGGVGQVTFSASGTNVRNRQSHTKTAGTYAIVSLIQLATNEFYLAGDTAL